MTAEEAIAFIHKELWQGSRPGLSRTVELLEKMDNPQNNLRFVHIAGTNGKGSTAAILASVLQSAGLCTGLYTSPYISRFNERMQVNGQPIKDEELAKITEYCAPLARSMGDPPTEFELVTAIAFEFFRRRGCDIVVLEVGLGGRLDSTNVIKKPLCSVITNIGLDHTRELGDTAEIIAAEKAGIIKSGRPTVIYDLPLSVREVISQRCAEQASPLFSADFSQIETLSDSLEGQVFTYKAHSRLRTPLLGAHQLKNAALVLETLDVLRAEGINITDENIRKGFLNTRWPARFELISENPYFIVDGGHNPQCAETVAKSLNEYFPDKKTVVLFGVLADKDYMGLAAQLNTAAAEFVTITPRSTRALSAVELAEKLKVFGKPVKACGSISQGIEAAMATAGKDGVVCSVGSLYFAGEVRAHFGRK